MCTGSLILAAAGLLKAGRPPPTGSPRRSCAASARSRSRERYVFDGKYVTGAGVSAGIDMALALAGRVAGDEEAERIQLAIEYDPQPPVPVGLARHRRAGARRPAHREEPLRPAAG